MAHDYQAARTKTKGSPILLCGPAQTRLQTARKDARVSGERVRQWAETGQSPRHVVCVIMANIMTEHDDDAWWLVPTPRPQASQRLFCMPYAGGSGTVFHRFAQGFSPDTEVHSLQLPGRGFRLREPAMGDFGRMLAQVLEVMTPRLDRPYALFGHSMGALVAFELVRALRRQGQRLPTQLFVSAARAPAAWSAIPVASEADPLTFWRAVNELYGTPVHGSVHPDVLTLAVPPLRADFALIASYRYTAEEPLTLPITAFVGTRDPMVRRDDALAWQAETRERLTVHEVAGPHLFLQDSAALVSAHVRAALAAS